MICSSKTKCSVFSQHLLFLFLICFKIWRFVAAKEEINRQTETTFHFRDMDQFKKSTFANKPRLRYYKALPRKISSPPIAKMNGTVNTSKSRISPIGVYLFKKKLPKARNYYSTLNHHSPLYLQTNKIAHNENNLHKSMINKRPASNLLPSQLLNLFWRQNSAGENDAIEKKIKKSLANNVFHHDFSRIKKGNIGNVHKINSNIEATAISPGVFYKKYFSKPNHRSNLNSKFKKMSSRLKERRILNDTENLSNVINQFTNIKMVPQTAHQKYLSPRRKNSNELFENNHVMNPVITDVEKLSKNQKNSDNNFKTQNIIHLKKKTITMELNNKRTSANKNSEKLRKLFNVIMANNNEKIKSNYRDWKNINKENEKNSTGIENAESFLGPFYSFRNQNESFTDSNNEKNKNLSDGVGSRKIPTDKNFGCKLNSIHNQKSFNLTTGDDGNSEFIVKYSEKIQVSPECENDSDALKNTEFGSPITEHVFNWGLETNISRGINFIENSDSVKPKENMVLRKNNEKSNIQLKIEKFERNDLIEPDHLETYSLAITKQKGQTQSPRGAISLIVMLLTSLTLIVLFLSCCSFLTTPKRTTFSYQIRKPLMNFFRSKFAFSKKRIKSVKNVVVSNTESPETTNVETKIHYEKKKTSPNSDRKDAEIFEISKSNTQESFEENNSNVYEDSQKDSTSDIKIDMQDSNVFNHSQESNKIQDLNNARRKYDSVNEKHAASNQENSTYFEKENILTTTTFSRKDYETMENTIETPWNWIFKNLEANYSFKGTQCEEVNQNNFVSYQNNLSEDIIQENTTKNAHSKKDRTLKCLSPEHDHYQFEIVKESEADSTFKVKQDEFFTKEIVHGYICENNIETYEQIRNPSEFSYPQKNKTNSGLWRENLINVKTKSVISLDKNSTFCDFKRISKINSNSQSQIPSVQVNQRITSTLNLPTNNEVNLNDTDVLPRCEINAETVIMKDISISPVIISDSSAAKCIVKNEQTVSDLSEQNQFHTSTSSYYPNSSKS